MAKKSLATEKVHIIALNKIRDKRGNLSVIETGKILPFSIARTYWIYDIPGGENRGGHAYHKSNEFIIALSGSFEVMVNNGVKEELFIMNRCNYGLYVPAGTWRQMRNFATNSIALVISSTPYNPRDYIRNFNEFTELKKKGQL